MERGTIRRIRGAMRIEIAIPPKEQAIREGCPVTVSRKGVKWKESCLGKMAKEMGVYVIHHGGNIKYVGKTNSPSMSFGMRLRREFQENASSGKHIYPMLASLTVPPEIMVSFFPTADVEMLVRATGMNLGSLQTIEILEAVLIQAYSPDFQRHNVKRMVAHLKKLGCSQDDLVGTLKATPTSDAPHQI
jgi:hypothetical protein